MARKLLWLCVVSIWVLLLLAQPGGCADEVKYGIGSWPEAGHGNHRALVQVDISILPAGQYNLSAIVYGPASLLAEFHDSFEKK